MIYRKDASIELKVEEIKDAGPSELEARYSNLLDKLKREGLWEKAKEKRISTSPPPKRVAIISPETSLAPADIRTSLGKDFTGAEIVECPCTEYSAEAIISALKFCEEAYVPFDVVVITRGGGGDFTPFNDPELVEAVARCKIPVVSAIGHSTDRTALDLISAKSLATPTAVGTWLKELYREFKTKKASHKKNITNALIGVAIGAALMFIILFILFFGSNAGLWK